MYRLGSKLETLQARREHLEAGLKRRQWDILPNRPSGAHLKGSQPEDLDSGSLTRLIWQRCSQESLHAAASLLGRSLPAWPLSDGTTT